MKNDTAFTKTAGLLAILSGPVALASIVCLFAAFHWDLDTAFTPMLAIAYQPDPSALLRWGWLLDMFGYYLPLLPALLALHHRLTPGAPLYSQLFSLGGLGYIFIGAIGAAMLAGATTPLYEVYQTSAGMDKTAAAQVFANLNNEVISGLWNLLSMFLAAVWWTGTGWLLRPAHKSLAMLSQALGLAAAVDVLGYILQSEVVSSIGLNFYLLAAPVWAVWLGIYLRKQS